MRLFRVSQGSVLVVASDTQLCRKLLDGSINSVRHHCLFARKRVQSFCVVVVETVIAACLRIIDVIICLLRKAVSSPTGASVFEPEVVADVHALWIRLP